MLGDPVRLCLLLPGVQSLQSLCWRERLGLLTRCRSLLFAVLLRWCLVQFLPVFQRLRSWRPGFELTGRCCLKPAFLGSQELLRLVLQLVLHLFLQLFLQFLTQMTEL
jgi:hypothetical protein